MNIYELSDMLDTNLVLTRYSNQGRRWSAQLHWTEIKDGNILSSSYGSGETPDEAVNDYINKIRGKLLVYNAGGETRRTLTAPDTLRSEP